MDFEPRSMRECAMCPSARRSGMTTSTRLVGISDASGSGDYKRVDEAVDEYNNRPAAVFFDIGALPGPVLEQILKACRALDVASVSVGSRALALSGASDQVRALIATATSTSGM
jgi:hypothetical protein